MTLVDGLKVDADGFFDHLADEAHQAITEIETAGCWTRSSMTQWFGAVDQTIDDSVALLKAVTDTLLELMKLALQWMLDTLSYQIQILPNDFQYTLIGQIFKAAKIDPTISVGHLVALVCAYPATLINGLHNGGSLFPTTASQAAAVRHVRALERRGLLGLSGSGSKHRRGPGHGKGGALGDGNDGWETGLGITAAVVQGIWGLNDIVVDLQTGTEGDGTEREASSFCAWIDIFCPVVLTILQWPSAQGPGGTTEYPFYGGMTPAASTGRCCPGSSPAASSRHCRSWSRCASPAAPAPTSPLRRGSQIRSPTTTTRSSRWSAAA